MEAKGSVGSRVMSLVTIGQSRQQAKERGKFSAVRCAQEKSEGEEIKETESGEILKRIVEEMNRCRIAPVGKRLKG